MKKFFALLVACLMFSSFSSAGSFAPLPPTPNPARGPEYNCKHVFIYMPYDKCIAEWNARAEEAKALKEQKEQEAKALEEKAKQEAYLNSPEYKQKLLEEKQVELEKKQAELEANQKALEEKTEKKMDQIEALAFARLGKKIDIIESLAEVIKSKDEAMQKKISLILDGFKVSKDEYTRDIGFYLSYLLH